jgi:hypothetical protein
MMPNKTEVKVVILWEHELIKAAQLLARLKHEPKDEDWFNAVKACYVALGCDELASGEWAVTVMTARKELAPAAAIEHCQEHPDQGKDTP